MGRIQQLDAQTANMIAAGEVVERPMGVVKELVENAIDAKADRIDIEITEGGITSLTVRDNGIGMDTEDAQMCFARHATSKIRNQNDLWSIHTLGFRGEALPSIASVSKVTLLTSDGKDTTKIQVNYGTVASAGPYPCDQGTEITVEGLFYQTPARLKHMRSAAYEASLIQNVVSQFALSHPEIAFRLISDGRDSFRSYGNDDLLEVIYQVYGRGAAENAMAVKFEDFDYTVSGYIVNPLITRASRTGMHIFLNGRMVRTYKLYRAVLDGYEDFIVKGRYPLVVLKVDMDPRLIDVNVHPSKWEVRLSKEIQLENLLKTEIRKALSGNMLAPAAEIREARVTYYEPVSFDTDALIRKAEETRASQVKAQEPVQQTAEKTIEEEREQDIAILKEITQEKEQVKQEKEADIPVFPAMDVIGQFHEKFILCAAEKGLVIIDQHAAQERVHYEEYCARLNTMPAMMDCLVPLRIHAGADMVNRVDEINAAASDLHITFEPFGKDSFMVRSVPVWMKDIDQEAFLNDVLDSFRNEKEIRYTHLEKKKIATMACHHSIRFHKSLTMDEMKEVVRQLSLCENPYHCPHGRPTFVILDEKELTKEFLR